MLTRWSYAAVSKFRVGSIVWLAFSRDETEMGFAFPKEWRQALVDSEPEKFRMPHGVDLKYNWAVVRLAPIDAEEMRELVVDAWSMVVPKYVARQMSAEHDTVSDSRIRLRPSSLRNGLEIEDRCASCSASSRPGALTSATGRPRSTNRISGWQIEAAPASRAAEIGAILARGSTSGER